MTVADPEIVGGVCGRSRAAEGREGWSVHGQESGEGAPHNLFSILDLKMASFGALWVPVGMHPHPPWIRHCCMNVSLPLCAL